MKTQLLIVAILLSVLNFYAQDNNSFGNKVKDQAKTSTENRSLNEVDKAVNKTFDKVEEGVIGIFKKKDKKDKEKNSQDNDGNSKNNTTKNDENNNEVSNKSETANNDKVTSYISKYDFISGEKVIVAEDFMQDQIGDYPAKWNTNGSGEVVSVSNSQGHWLMLGKRGKHIPDFINDLPENFTYEFDLICSDKFDYYSPWLDIFFLTGKNNNSVFDYSFIGGESRSGVKISFHPHNAANKGGTIGLRTFENGKEIIKNEIETKQFNSLIPEKTKIHVAVWRQKGRLRVYVNEEKVIDVPRAFLSDKKYSTTLFEIWSDMSKDADKYFISNIKLAVGAPDTRNKLLTEGKFVTTGILFDVNSDKIKPESYGVIKEIASVLKENSDVKIKIIGHTDSDGDEKANLDLSKKRSSSVKNALVKEFSISADRITTDGMGESQPVAPNDTPVNKAQNRRVEFVKL